MKKKIYKTVRKLSNINAAYVAALIDGEGTITLSRNNRNKQRALIVEIDNTDFKLLDWIKNLISSGGIRSKRPKNTRHKTGYIYKISNRQALNLLTQITPYLRTYKRKRAEIVLKNYIKLTPRNGKYSPEIFTQREKFVKNFFAINGSREITLKL